ncbi:MAG: pyridine nucleotide-disulfide oxidoreductase [Candidatus Altiarchaeales archaeon]|nr:MAG: pyridine nucleotide-disulfide oxidoreductase [Candidatus Altiarchaeales archaeon]RLI94787.1 MAG: pyridine nucleotide-disulfide oxidoreductase [Candidatus Altiarchaeales archaeon]HDO82168.1 pyridine nucleotide-disulfide oxidoreductase [Candidatus Altiarchaeales archaeon]HEX54817.1 pyridine nucleotide-disulfide oxidoreductase [Candidatus Altiarchaeales archaeon]
MRNLVIVGGGEAGFISAITAKKTNPRVNITLINDSKEFYSPCALPFVISNEVGIEDIVDDLEEMCRESGINCVIDTVVLIDTKNRVVKTKNGHEFRYDSLIIATGGTPFIPKIPGIELDGVHTLKTIEDARRIMEVIKGVKNAVVIGGGAIGVEISAALRKRNLNVTLVEICEHLLPKALDPEFSAIVERKLSENGINLLLNSKVDEIIGENRVDSVIVNGDEIKAEIVVIGTGVIPRVELVRDCGIEIFGRGIKTDGFMRTNIENVYAAGDCVDSRSLLTGKLMLSQLATTALRHAMTAGTNAVGGYATFEGVLNSMLLKVFDIEIGRTGLTENDARENEIETITGVARGTTRSHYFPGSKEILVKLIFNELNRSIIGAQIIGGEGVAGKIDLIAFAIVNNARIEDLIKLKYCYTPSSAPPRNVIVLAAENARRKLQRREEERKRKFERI